MLALVNKLQKMYQFKALNINFFKANLTIRIDLLTFYGEI